MPPKKMYYVRQTKLCSHIKQKSDGRDYHRFHEVESINWEHVLLPQSRKDNMEMQFSAIWAVLKKLPLSIQLWVHFRRNHSYLFQTVVSNHCGCTPRGVGGVKRPEILWEIQKHSLPGLSSSQNWVKSKTIKKCIKIP